MRPRRLSDVFFLKVRLRPVTRCEPPEGQRCCLAEGSTLLTHAQAKLHALESPGHYVVREETTRTTFMLEVGNPP